mgnify:FL=1
MFIRDPIDRFKSGLAQQMKHFNLSQEIVDTWVFGVGNNQPDRKLESSTSHVLLLDNHTIPQFWSMLRLSRLVNINLKILPLSQYSILHPDAKYLNENSIKLIL